MLDLDWPSFGLGAAAMILAQILLVVTLSAYFQRGLR